MLRSMMTWLFAIMAWAASLLWGLAPARSQGSAQVTVTITAGKLIAWSAAGGGVEESLEPGESVITSGARGHTGFVQTTTRLLGFSAGLRNGGKYVLGWRNGSNGTTSCRF